MARVTCSRLMVVREFFADTLSHATVALLSVTKHSHGRHKSFIHLTKASFSGGDYHVVAHTHSVTHYPMLMLFPF